MKLPELPPPNALRDPTTGAGIYYTEAQMLAFQRDTVEACAEAACGEVAFNGGSVQMEAHVRQAIRSLLDAPSKQCSHKWFSFGDSDVIACTLCGKQEIEA